MNTDIKNDVKVPGKCKVSSMNLKLFSLEWDPADYDHEYMVCVARNIEEALEKFKAEWMSKWMMPWEKRKFFIELMEPGETMDQYIGEHDIDEIIEFYHSE